MPYNTPLGGFSRLLTPQIAIHSCPFSVLNILKVGARMTLIKLPNDNIIIWSAVPYGPEAERCLELLQPYNKVTNVIIPDSAHTMAARDYVSKFPGITALGVDGVNEASSTTITAGKINKTHANRILKGSELADILKVLKGPELADILKGENAKDLVDNFEFVYFAGHKNNELVMYHPNTKTLFEADLLFNVKPKSEQYGNEDPTTGLSFIARYIQPYSAGNRDAISAVASWDFERIVVSHGEVIEGKNESRLAFDSVYGHFYK
ncbi:hypothetical protein BABINDRAFT_175580 [Babjeviella inositovora NRRL Y-12698]|uniref:Metallo-beta-lactamase domain-containing protein n=1 Tax=Babjeviella inositovora NRRL Y-12698 TaxID=984486 RepID=A0A1E3QR06_9ASCO|nr:uncharacterized protein BABINDRAFT_175580 [Babjeviella inositovora NRRL Y-12698]ODQ80146.1 hypothetical protein BABINDRAFT_175580 [Babjeviella inositovora NRRL Y-12698]